MQIEFRNYADHYKVLRGRVEKFSFNTKKLKNFRFFSSQCKTIKIYSSPLYNDEREWGAEGVKKKFMHRITLLNINFSLNIIKNASPVNCIRHKVVSIGWMLPHLHLLWIYAGSCVRTLCSIFMARWWLMWAFFIMHISAFGIFIAIMYVVGVASSL
jgi:hypothetical protein